MVSATNRLRERNESNHARRHSKKYPINPHIMLNATKNITEAAQNKEPPVNRNTIRFTATNVSGNPMSMKLWRAQNEIMLN